MGSRFKQPKKGRQTRSAEWRQCNHCGLIVYFKDEQCHFEECSAIKLKKSDSDTCSSSPLASVKSSSQGNLELQHCYVDNGALHAKVSNPHIKDLDWKCQPKLKNLILMHPSTMRLCKILTNGYVTVVGSGYKAIHVAWPSHCLDRRLVAFQPLERIFHFHPGSKVVVQTYSGIIPEAEEITFVPMEPEKECIYSEEFGNYASYKLYNELLAVGMTIAIKYWEYPVQLTVAKISTSKSKSCPFDEEQSPSAEMENSAIQNITDRIEKSASIGETCDDSICNVSADCSFDPEAFKSFSTPISSAKTSRLSPSFSEEFKHVDSLQDSLNVCNTGEEYFKVTAGTVITIQKKKTNLSVKKTTFDDVKGLNEQLDTIKTRMRRLFCEKDIHSIDSKMYDGILLYGPSGTGKTLVGQAIETECGLPFINVIANEVIVRHYGSEEKEVQRRFEEAIEKAPSVIFLDAIDELCCWKKDTASKRGNRVLLTLIHMFDKLEKELKNPLLIVATTRDASAIHSKLRVFDKFNIEIEFKMPSPSERHEILQKLMENEQHSLTCEEISEVASMAHAYTGSDLAVVCCEARSLAGLRCIRNGIRDRKEYKKVRTINFLDVTDALKEVTPFSMINQEVKIEKVSWDDICGMYEVKKRLQQAVEWPLKFPELFSRYNMSPTSGILMHGPPGCSKTMLAKALATETGLNFIPVKGPELFNKWYGESERAVRELFTRARASKPCIIFLDEVDALLAGRESSSDGSDVGRKVVCQFLSEFGGIGACDGIIVIAATNRPDILDEAVLRPGRIGELIEVPLPDAETRKEILEKKLQQMPVSDEIDFELLVEKTKGFSGAQVVAVCKEAAWLLVEEENYTNSSKITMSLMCQAVEDIRKPDATYDDYD